MKKEGIGLWIYRNQGGERIQAELKKALERKGMLVFNDFDLRRCFVKNGRVFTESGHDLSNLLLLYHMNADEQSSHQIRILEALEKSSVRLINSHHSFLAASDKFIANLLMRNNHVRVPESALLTKETPKNIIKDLMSQWGSIVVKPRFSYGGKGVLRFESDSSLMDFIEATQNFYDDFYVEKFIPFKDRDFRVEILDGEYVGSYSRGLLHSFKTNMKVLEKSSDGVFLKNPPDDEQIAEAKKAAIAVSLDATIVDMVRSTEDDQFYVLEVNCMLGIFVEAANALMGIRPVDSSAYHHAADSVKLAKLTDFLIRKKECHEKAIDRYYHERDVCHVTEFRP